MNMSSEDRIKITLTGGAPWGFRLSGGGGLSLTVVQIREGSAAHEQGLLDGDSVIAINSESVHDKSLAEAAALMDEAGCSLGLDITRNKVQPDKPSVNYNQDGDAVADVSTSDGDAVADVSTSDGDAVADVSTSDGDAVADVSTSDGDAVADVSTSDGGVVVPSTDDGVALVTSETTERDISYGEFTLSATVDDVSNIGFLENEAGSSPTFTITTSFEEVTSTSTGLLDSSGGTTSDVVVQEVSDSVTSDVVVQEVSDSVTSDVVVQEVSDSVSAGVVVQEVVDGVSAEVVVQEVSDSVSADVAVQEASDSVSADVVVQEVSDSVSADVVVHEIADSVSADVVVQEASYGVPTEVAVQEDSDSVSVDVVVQENSDSVSADVVVHEIADSVSADVVVQEVSESISADVAILEVSEGISADVAILDVSRGISADVAILEVSKGISADVAVPEVSEDISADVAVLEVSKGISADVAVLEVSKGISADVAVLEVSKDNSADVAVLEVSKEISADVAVLEVAKSISADVAVLEVAKSISADVAVVEVSKGISADVAVLEVSKGISADVAVLEVSKGISADVAVLEVSKGISADVAVLEVSKGISADVAVLEVSKGISADVAVLEVSKDISADVAVLEVSKGISADVAVLEVAKSISADVDALDVLTTPGLSEDTAEFSHGSQDRSSPSRIVASIPSDVAANISSSKLSYVESIAKRYSSSELTPNETSCRSNNSNAPSEQQAHQRLFEAEIPVETQRTSTFNVNSPPADIDQTTIPVTAVKPDYISQPHTRLLTTTSTTTTTSTFAGQRYPPVAAISPHLVQPQPQPSSITPSRSTGYLASHTKASLFKPSKFVPASEQRDILGSDSPDLRVVDSKGGLVREPLFQVTNVMSRTGRDIWRPNIWLPEQLVPASSSESSPYPSLTRSDPGYSSTGGQGTRKTVYKTSIISLTQPNIPYDDSRGLDSPRHLPDESYDRHKRWFATPVESHLDTAHLSSSKFRYQEPGQRDDVSYRQNSWTTRRNHDSTFNEVPRKIYPTTQGQLPHHPGKIYPTTQGQLPHHPGTSYPTTQGHLQLGKKISQPQTSTPTHSSWGAKMSADRKDKQGKWIHEGHSAISGEDVANLQDLASSGSSDEDDPYLFRNYPEVRHTKMALTPVQCENLRQHSSQHDHAHVTPDLCFGITSDLKAERGRGGRLFQRRKLRADKFIIDDETVKAAPPPSRSGPLMSAPPRPEKTHWEASREANGDVSSTFSHIRDWESSQRAEKSPIFKSALLSGGNYSLKQSETAPHLGGHNFNRIARGWTREDECLSAKTRPDDSPSRRLAPPRSSQRAQSMSRDPIPQKSWEQVPPKSWEQVSTKSWEQVPPKSWEQVPPRTSRRAQSVSREQVMSKSWEQVPTKSWEQVPTKSWEQVPTKSWEQVPTMSWEQVPTKSWEQVPTKSWEQVPPKSWEQVPTKSWEHVSTKSSEHVPSKTSRRAQSVSREQVLSKSWEQVPTKSWEQVPPKSLEQVSPSSDESLSYRQSFNNKMKMWEARDLEETKKANYNRRQDQRLETQVRQQQPNRQGDWLQTQVRQQQPNRQGDWLQTQVRQQQPNRQGDWLQTQVGQQQPNRHDDWLETQVRQQQPKRHDDDFAKKSWADTVQEADPGRSYTRRKQGASHSRQSGNYGSLGYEGESDYTFAGEDRLSWSGEYGTVAYRQPIIPGTDL